MFCSLRQEISGPDQNTKVSAQKALYKHAKGSFFVFS